MAYLAAPDGTQIYYTDWNTGSPVVLIHGWPLNSDMWEQQAALLAAEGLRVIAYDRRGFGRSGQPWTGHDYDTYAADLNALMEGLNLRGATLVGFSMGGGEVVRYLSRYGSSRVKRAVLVSAVTPYLLKSNDNPDGVDNKVFTGIEEQIAKDRPAFLGEFAAKFYGRTMMNHTVSEPVLDWFRSMGLTGSLRSTLASANAWSTTDFREDMKNITIPVLIIHGTGDVTVPIDVSARRSLAILPNATLSEYEDAPHGLFLTSANRLNHELLAFIAGSADPITDPIIA